MKFILAGFFVVCAALLSPAGARPAVAMMGTFTNVVFLPDDEGPDGYEIHIFPSHDPAVDYEALVEFYRGAQGGTVLAPVKAQGDDIVITFPANLPDELSGIVSFRGTVSRTSLVGDIIFSDGMKVHTSLKRRKSVWE